MALTTQQISDYKLMFDTQIIEPSKAYIIDAAVKKINAGKPQYQAIEALTKVPWYFIGMVHYRESGCDFTKHLHNGDSLTARTTHIPAGRPVTGKPPFTFTQSAIDALTYQKLTGLTDWSIPAILYRLEAYNGFGYRSHGINSPYLWSFTQFYTTGLYVKDSVFDPKAVSKQAGAAPILRRIMEINNLYTAVASISIGVVILICGIAYLIYQK